MSPGDRGSNDKGGYSPITLLYFYVVTFAQDAFKGILVDNVGVVGQNPIELHELIVII